MHDWVLRVHCLFTSESARSSKEFLSVPGVRLQLWARCQPRHPESLGIDLVLRQAGGR